MGLFKKKRSIDDIAEQGNALFEEENYMKAIDVWKEGLDSIKKPLNMQGEAVWFQTSIADAYYMLDNYEKAYEYLMDAKSNISGEGYNNPFVMLRLGQCCYELNKGDTQEYLMRAYMLAGKEIFEDEEDKYFNCIQELVK